MPIPAYGPDGFDIGPGPLIIAHRGWHEHLPENSISAFQAAWRGGFAWCECDIRQSADGAWWILHDETLDRTTTGHGPIAAHSSASLRHVKLKASDERLPTLEAALATMPADAAMLIEIKSPLSGAETHPLVALAANRRTVFQSFDLDSLQELRRAMPNVPLAFLADDRAALDADLSVVQSVFVHHPLLRNAQRAIKRKTLGVWTINAEAEIRSAIALGAQAIITDRPQWAAQILGDAAQKPL